MSKSLRSRALSSSLRLRRGIKARLVPVELDDRVIEFAIDRDSSDPIANALAEQNFPGDSVNKLWRHLVRPQSTVIDVGAHLGMYALPAAAVGARVIAIEASPTNATLLELAAKRNSFTNLEILRGAAGAGAGTVAFVALGPFGHIASPEELLNNEGSAGVEVTTMALDDVIRERGLGRVDLIKIDVEGSELTALAGLEQLLARNDAPPLLVEANGHMLSQYGHVPEEILAKLEGYGYRCYLVDSSSPGRLVPVDSDVPQPECVADYLASKSIPDQLAPWWIDRPLERAEIISRWVRTTETHDDHRIHRTYGERLMARAPIWMKEDERVKNLQGCLRREYFGPFPYPYEGPSVS